ncbi:UNVERIFIED_ORG: hypothetical protein M2438_001577 [Methylobacterium sp. SuP10 SLI 274]|uniref:hypothetical protein n=1 Tax=Methylorubrum extorquens TaxID=408 RepID=UPI0020A0E9C5|nr:hypothetical protein [Methylorubrum extorquens]MDF9862791.1 hypothetical protein [Methylorubrum pseudosasae]MDH6636402.1 hypothetical protein [Methylobacterium sp. SuP10 SLI 274]MDH6665582.1 hypothetical protein [Methylorubrum zatmanii]MCP1557500.1 hypothetical protein [Methylorubrum extorquens]MDF9791087.1 hypothetical protein [Methylorubrum extorquens]
MSDIKRMLSGTKELHVLRTGDTQYVVTDNLLRNLVSRDILPVTKTFDEHFAAKLTQIDALFSETAFLFLLAQKADERIDGKYSTVFIGLLQNALNTFGSSVILLRSGLPGQSMVLLRQVVEICSTIIHIAGDPKAKAIDDFIAGNYNSTTSIGQAKKAVPIIGLFWGFLSNSFVHINHAHSMIQPIRPYKQDNAEVEAIIKCLRMTVWICYLTAEIAFPMLREHNRYWQRRVIDGRHAVEYAPSPEEREWAAAFLNLEEVGPDDLEGFDGQFRSNRLVEAADGSGRQAG